MGICAGCGSETTRAPLSGVVYDTCAACGGVFLSSEDAAEADADVGLLFGGGPGSGSALGPSMRKCPVHGGAMTSYRVIAPSGALTVERAECCGGIYLDPGESTPLLAAAQRAGRLAAMAAEEAAPAKRVVTTASGATFAAPPPPGGEAFGASLRRLAQSPPPRGRPSTPYRLNAAAPSERRCPRCHANYRADRQDGMEIDVCPQCGSMFLDAPEVDAKGVPTAVLFGVGPGAARSRGVSSLRCPRCGEVMEVFDVDFIAGPIEVDRANCCGGLFLDGGEHEPFLRAARAAENAAADAHFAAHGEYVGEAAINTTLVETGALDAMVAAEMRARVDAMMLRMVREAKRHSRHSRWNH